MGRLTKIILIMILVLIGCSSSDQIVKDGAYNGEITIKFDFGERVGKYKGEVINSLPEGYGEFTSAAKDGTKWTYKGQWKNGLMDGDGITEWKNGNKQIGLYEKGNILPISQSEMNKFFTSPNVYKYNIVEIKGEIFTTPEYYDGGVAIQMYTDIENSDKNVIVYLQGSDIDVKNGDMLKVNGVVGEVFEGQNAFGAKLSIPTISSASFEKIAYEDFFPVITEKSVNITQEQLGYKVTIKKVVVTTKETRVYVEVENQGKANFNLYSFNTKIIQGGRQFEEQSNWQADYPEVQTNLSPGVITEGIITYPTIKDDKFQLILEGSSDDYSQTLDDYFFEIDFD